MEDDLGEVICFLLVLISSVPKPSELPPCLLPTHAVVWDTRLLIEMNLINDLERSGTMCIIDSKGDPEWGFNADLCVYKYFVWKPISASII